MALFPKCEFRVFWPNGAPTSGTRANGILELDAPEPIPRAEHLHLVFHCVAWAGYGSGKSRSVVRPDVFYTQLRLALPHDKELPAGTHRFPFAIDLPAWVLPSLIGNDCGIMNRVEVRLDVDWAKDPVGELAARIVLPPTEGVLSPLVTRSPPGFHDSIVLEVTLESSVLLQGQPIVGRVALRGGHGARFDAIELGLSSLARIVMHRRDHRLTPASPKVRIPAEAMRQGQGVPFVVTPSDWVPCTFRSPFIDHALRLDVSVDVPWASDPSFGLGLLVYPPGTRLHPSPDAFAAPAVVGSERLALLASYMAQATGLRPGRLPTLVEGTVGAVDVRISDSPREGLLGLDVELLFPDVELGMAFRRIGFLGAPSPLVPEPLRDAYVVRFEPNDVRPPLAEAALRTLLHAMLEGLEEASELHASDHHLTYRVPLDDDGSATLHAIAHAACARARAIEAAIATLPFPPPAAASAPAWRATAAEQSAALVPSGPSLHGLVFRSRIVGGEERAMVASIRTVWTEAGPGTAIELDLGAMPLPRAALDAIAAPESPLLAGLRSDFAIYGSAPDHATLERPGITPDPRSLFAGIETFFAWLLDARGERRAEAAYR